MIQSIISFTTSHTFNKKKNVVESSDHCTLITNLAGIVRMQFQRSYGFISISQQRPGPGKICSKNGSGSPGTGHRNTEEKTSKVGEYIFLNQKKLNLNFECVKYVAVALILSCFKSFYDENTFNAFVYYFSIDNETAKRRENKGSSETYIPTYVTSEDIKENQEKDSSSQKKDEFDGDIWELAGRSNSKNPRQDLGQIKSEL